MSDAWSTVVVREPEWDDRSRSEAIAGVLAGRINCQNCGQADAMVEVDIKAPDGEPKGRPHVGWRSGNTVVVGVYRCEACASVQAVERQLTAEDEKHAGSKSSERAQRADGRRVVAVEVKKGGAKGG